MSRYIEILAGAAVVVILAGCQTADSAITGTVVLSKMDYVRRLGLSSCPDVNGVYEADTLSIESDPYLRKSVRGWLTGMFLAGGVAQERRYTRGDGRKLLQRFDYVRLQQSDDKSITVSVGYADEDEPRGSHEIPLNDGKRKCDGTHIETFTQKTGGGEGFSSKIDIHAAIRKDVDGSIVVVETWSESKTVAFIPIGSERRTFTYRFRPWNKKGSASD